MGAYLLDNPPVRDQYRTTRRAKPTGCIGVHTAETDADFTPPDSAAENVANFIRTRTTPGSYHDLADADSIIHLVPYEYEAYGDGTGSNRFATHVSGAVQAGKWAAYPVAHRDAVVKNMARAAANQARWVKAKHGITVPAKRITKAQSDAGQPGFISHAERDPTRRSDPGAHFPWGLFLSTYAALMGGNEEDDMPTAEEIAREVWAYKNPAVTDRDAYNHLTSMPDAADTALKVWQYRSPAAVHDAYGYLVTGADPTQLAAAIAALLPEGVEVGDEQLERVFRTVIGSVDNPQET